MATNGLLIQAQRIPIGYFRTPQGKEVPVIVSSEWYKVLGQLADAVSAGGDGGSTNETDDEGVGPGDALGALLGRAAASGVDAAGPEAGAFAGALLVAALERVQALEIDSGLSRLSAQVEAIAQRVAAIEQGNETP